MEISSNPPLAERSFPVTIHQPFIEAARLGFHPVGPLSFTIPLIRRRDVDHYVTEACSHAAVLPMAVAWGEEGAVVDFQNDRDLALFSLAYRGPRMRD